MRLLDFIKNGFQKAELTAVDIYHEKPYLIQLKKTRQGIKLHRMIEIPQPPPSNKPISPHSIKTKALVSFIPRRLSLVKEIGLPSTEPSEIKELLKYEVDGLTPYSAEELIYDYYILKTENGYSHLMLFLLRKEIVEEHLESLRRIFGAEPETIQLSSACLFNWFMAEREESLKHPFILLEINENGFDFLIIEEGKLLFSRGVELKGKDKENILSELKQSLTLYQTKEGPSPEEMILIHQDRDGLVPSDSKPLTELVQSLEKAFSLKVRIKNPLGNIQVDKGLIVNHSLSTTLGLALERYLKQPLALNFLPLSVRQRRKLKAKRRQLLIRFLLIFTTFTLLGAISSYRLHKEKTYIRNVKSRLNVMRPVVRKIEDKRIRLGVIRDRLIHKVPNLDILSELFRITPPEVALNMFLISPEARIILRGQTQELSLAFDYITILEKSDYFGNVKVNYAYKRKIKEKELVDFEFNLQCDFPQALRKQEISNGSQKELKKEEENDSL